MKPGPEWLVGIVQPVFDHGAGPVTVVEQVAKNPKPPTQNRLTILTQISSFSIKFFFKKKEGCSGRVQF